MRRTASTRRRRGGGATRLRPGEEGGDLVQDLVAVVKDQEKIKDAQKEKLDALVAKYEGGLPGPAAFTLAKMVVGMPALKEAFEEVVPGYMSAHTCCV